MTETGTIPASSTFEAFLSPGLDRCAFIDAWLRAREIPHTVVELAGKRHIVVRFAGDVYNPLFRMKTLVAHYDRVPDTPGANDNSAACFQLMLFAERLAAERQNRVHNIRIFFTDGEEAAGTKGIAGQGAYALGEGFRKLKMTDDDIYVFDACGRGDTLILSTAGMELKTKKNLSDRLANLHGRATSFAVEASPGGWLKLPTPYSDNAGFLAAGIASQIITVLPHEEAETLLQATGKSDGKDADRTLADLIVAHKPLKENSPYRDIIPETWRLMHTKGDSARTLSASAFTVMARFLEALADSQEPAITGA